MLKENEGRDVQISESLASIRLFLSKASLNDSNITHVELRNSPGAISKLFFSWVSENDGHEGAIDVLIRDSKEITSVSGVVVSNSTIIPEKLRVKDLESFLVIEGIGSIFEVKGNIYVETGDHFTYAANRIVNMIKSITSKYIENNDKGLI